ncbi:MAG TPA: sortase [Streptosporangiaceae bacterium]|nr:sortase [Streptosporangiaceae bacterium]
MGKIAGRHAAPVSRPVRVSLIAVLAGSLVTMTGCAGVFVSNWDARPAYVALPVPHVPVPRGRIAAVPEADQDVSAPLPVYLIIPAIGVRTRLIRLGTTSAGAMAVPSTTAVAGWYAASPRPGAIGSSVIAGHVDSYRGPGIFFRLRLLHAGDRVFVVRANGTLAVFKITEVRRYRKSRFPFKRVFGPVPYAGLRLITCGGVFDYATRQYLSDVVVYATEAGSAGT